MKTVVFRQSWFKTFNRWKPEMVVEFINALESFMNDEEVVITNDRVLDLWEQAEPLLITDKEKYNKVVERNRENGKKGGAPKGNKNADKTTQNNQVGNKTTEWVEIQPKTTQLVEKQPKTTQNNLSDSDGDIDSDKDSDMDIEQYRASGEKIIEVDLYFHKTSQLKGYLDKGYTLIYKGKPFGYEDLEVLNIII